MSLKAPRPLAHTKEELWLPYWEEQIHPARVELLLCTRHCVRLYDLVKVT